MANAFVQSGMLEKNVTFAKLAIISSAQAIVVFPMGLLNDAKPILAMDMADATILPAQLCVHVIPNMRSLIVKHVLTTITPIPWMRPSVLAKCVMWILVRITAYAMYRRIK